MTVVLTLDEVASIVHKSRRWLREWLRDNPRDVYDRPLFGKAGRTMLFTQEHIQRIVELLSTPGPPVRPERKYRRRPSPYASKDEEQLWVRAAELTGDKSLLYWRKGEVYFIEAGDFIKIGFATSPLSRVQTIKTGCPLPIKIIYHERGGRNLERKLHRQFAHIRSRGEWFHKTESRKRLAPMRTMRRCLSMPAPAASV